MDGAPNDRVNKGAASRHPEFSFQSGNTPLLVSIPHAGTDVPPAISERLTPAARLLPDTDWFVDRLYHWVTAQGAGLLVANYSRYVIDLNRPPDDAALYALRGTGLVPECSFDGTLLYLADGLPDERERNRRKQQFWQPYHQQLAAELERLRQRFGYAILLDAHSIRAEVPRLFKGTLSDLNLGSFKGASADPDLVSTSLAALGSVPGYSLVVDGRFQGGYITRHYGQPGNGYHALQLEMAQTVYMHEQPPTYDLTKAAGILPLLHNLITALILWAPAGA